MNSLACVIPTHSRNDYLEAALRSVAAQSLRPEIVVVVSDVRNPEAQTLCEKLSRAEGMAISYIESPKDARGASSSRNIGTLATDSELVAYLDDDDLWKPGYVEAVVAAATAADLVITWIDEFGDGHARQGPRMREGYRGQDVAAINPGATGSNIVVRRSWFDAIGGFDTNLPVKNDTDFLYRSLRAGARYSIVESPNVLQRKHASGQLTARTERRAAGTEQYVKKHLASLTADDIRVLRQQIERIRSFSARTRLLRWFHTMRMVRYYRREDLWRVLRRGRDRSHARVAAFEEDSR